MTFTVLFVLWLIARHAQELFDGYRGAALQLTLPITGTLMAIVALLLLAAFVALVEVLAQWVRRE